MQARRKVHHAATAFVHHLQHVATAHTWQVVGRSSGASGATTAAFILFSVT